MKFAAFLVIFPLFSVCSQEAVSQVRSVWNHAYQETWNSDSVEDILAHARDSYVLLDAYDDTEARVAIPAIKADGNLVAVYISVGTGEDWREDFDYFEDSLVERYWGEWPGEYFIDRITDDLMRVMKSRIDLAAAWGADYIEFDNMDWAFDEVNRKKYGFHVTEEESLVYVNSLKDYASASGLKCMAKNMTKGVESFAGVTYESWPDDKNWWDPADLRSFLSEGKLCIVFHYKERNPDKALAEYRDLYGSELLVLIETRSARGYLR
jgi:cysteinyl-tRNA synthetase